jgi:N-glycosylase/DNA lyase
MEYAVIDLETTLFCGQSFSWSRDGDMFSAVLDGQLFTVRQATIYEQCTDNPFLQHYFDMDWDYAKADDFLCSLGSPLSEAVSHARGLHLLNQDPWEVLIGFILSQNNNIKRITQLYERLSTSYGTEVSHGRFSFPTPSQLAGVDEAELRALGVGFRSPYLLDAIRQSHLLETIHDRSFPEALETLQTIKGVGPKVGSCILLYGYHRMEAFPMDTWMKKVMARWFPEKDSSLFSPYEALAQQYLFHYIRTMGGR